MRVFALLLVVALSGCGGTAGSSSAAVPVVGGNRAGTVGGIYLAGLRSALGFDLTGDPNSPVGAGLLPSLELDGIYGPVGAGEQRRVNGLAVARDGRVYAIVSVIAPSPNGDLVSTWTLKVYASGARGSAQPERIITGTGYGVGVALENDAIDVLVRIQDCCQARGYIASYPYGTGDNPAPLRSMPLNYAPVEFAVDASGRVYVETFATIRVYARIVDGTLPPTVRIVSMPPGVNTIQFAVEPSGAIWAMGYLYSTGPPPTVVSTTLYHFGTSNNGPTADRSIQADGYVKNLAIDANQVLYTVLFGLIRVYPPNSSRSSADIVVPYRAPGDQEEDFSAPLLAVGPAPTASR